MSWILLCGWRAARRACQRHVVTGSESGEMCYVEHHFPPTNYKLPPVCTGAPEASVNRSSAVTDGGLRRRVTDMREWREERGRVFHQNPFRVGANDA